MRLQHQKKNINRIPRRIIRRYQENPNTTFDSNNSNRVVIIERRPNNQNQNSNQTQQNNQNNQGNKNSNNTNSNTENNQPNNSNDQNQQQTNDNTE